MNGVNNFEKGEGENVHRVVIDKIMAFVVLEHSIHQHDQ
jgi:hypothetical protein